MRNKQIQLESDLASTNNTIMKLKTMTLRSD